METENSQNDYISKSKNSSSQILPNKSTEEYFLEILKNLELTYRCHNNNQRKESENFLKQSEYFIITNISYIITKIKSKTISKELSNSLLIYIRNIILKNKSNNTNNNKNFTNFFTKETIKILLKEFVNCIMDIDFPENCQKEINKNFEELINSPILEKDLSIIDELILFFKDNILNNKINLSSYKGISYIFVDILCASCINKSNCNKIIKIELECTNTMLTNSINYLTNLSSNLSGNFHEEKDKILNVINTIKVIFELLLNISVHSQKTYNNVDNFIMHLKTTFQLFAIKMLNFTFEEDNDIVIKMKIKISKFIISLLPLLKNNFCNNNKDIYQIHNSIIIYYLNFFNDKNKNLIETSHKNKNLENLITQIIIYLSNVTFTKLCDDNLKCYIIPFIKNIMLPLLIATSDDLESIEDDEDGNNYAIYIYDMLTSKKFTNLKEALANFLYILCKHENNIICFFIEYNCMLIKYSLNLVEKDALFNKTMSNNNNNNLFSKDDYMLSNNITYINRIETSIFALCLLSKILFEPNITNLVNNNNNKNYIISIYIFFREIYKNLLIDKYIHIPIIRERICLFISIYIKKFLHYENPELNINFLNDISEYLFNNIFISKKSIGKYESFESLKYILSSNEQFKNNFGVVTKKYLNQFILFIESSNNLLLYDVLIDILPPIIDENDIMVKLIKILFSKIIKLHTPRRLSQYETEENNMKLDSNNNNNIYNICKVNINDVNKNKYVIEKCLNLIKIIFTFENFLKNNINLIEELLKPLVGLMKYPYKISFSEQIIEVFTQYIRTLKFLPNSSINLLPNLCQYLRKNKGMTIDLFSLFDEYILQSKNSNNINKSNFEELCKIIFKNFKKSLVKEKNIETSSYLGICLIQNLFINNDKIPEQLVSEIISFISVKLEQILFSEKSNHSDMTIQIDMQNVSLALTSFISICFVNYFHVIYKNIQLDFLLKILEFQNGFISISTYQVKLLIIGMCNYIYKLDENIITNLINEICNLINIIYKFIIKKQNIIYKPNVKNIIKNDKDINDEDLNNDSSDFNCNIKRYESENLNKTSNSSNKNDIESKSKSFNESSSFLSMSNISGKSNIDYAYDIQELDNHINNELKNINENILFVNLLEKIQNNYNQIYLNWINSMNNQQKDYFYKFINEVKNNNINN